MRIPFYKPSIGEDEINEVVDTLRGGWLTTGPKTKQFEAEFAAYLGQKHAVALNSCTAALHLALEAIGLKAGQGVIVPTMTFAATAEVVRYFGARPLLVDCRPEDLNLDVADAERKIQAALAEGIHVAAIIPVHYGGQIGDVHGVQTLARKYQLKVIEDAAHCCPAYYWETEMGDGRWEMEEGRGETTEKAESGKATPHPTLSPAEAERATGPRKSEVAATPHPTLSPVEAERATQRQDRETLGLRNFQLSTFNSQPTKNGGDTSPYPLPGRGGEGRFSPVGTSADITCFSFYANKTITTGEGGMACTNNDEYADRMRIMSLHGISRDAWKRFTAEGSWYYEIIAPGFKYNLTDIAAAIGLHQVRKADLLHRRRCEVVKLYQESLADVEELILPREQPGRIHSWHLYSIRLVLDRLTIDRAQFISELAARGIGTSVHWMPLHMHPYYRETYGYKPEDLPIAASLYPQLVTLPVYPDMSPEEVGYVCASIKEILVKSRKGSATVPVAPVGVSPTGNRR